MGSIDLETANMFSEDEDDIPPPPEDLAPLSPMRDDQPMENGEGLFDDIPGTAEPKEGAGIRAKRMVRRNPQPKLDHNRLTGDRGLPIVVKTFEKIKFKGKGYEKDDLNTLMMTMEHWGNRLFPKMTFDEVIERIEKLGKKKPVQTCVKKIRMDMPLMDEDFVNREEEDDGVIRGEAKEDDDPLPDLPNATTTPGNVSYGTLDITDDQKRRMEENKRKAMEKRAAKMQQSQSQNPVEEIPDEIQSQPNNTEFDSDEEDMANEMWSDLMSQQTSTQKPNNEGANQSKKSQVHNFDSDEEDLEREAWNEISKSQVKKPVERAPEYDEETDDDDEYEKYFMKLKGFKPQKAKGIEVNTSNTSENPSKTDTQENPVIEEDEQSLSILNSDAIMDKDTDQSLNATSKKTIENPKMDKKDDDAKAVEKDGQSLSILNSDALVDKDDKDTETDQSQSILDESMNLHLSSSSADEGTESDMPTTLQSKDSDKKKDTAENPSLDDDATCLPDDTNGDDDDQATCLPDDPTEDLETQLPEDNVDTLAEADTMAMTDELDTAEANTVAMATQEIKDSVDTAEADTLEVDVMDTAEAETQAIC